VVPNSSPYHDPDIQVHDDAARRDASTGSYWTRIADAIGIPLLIPVFPHPTQEIYTHALDKETMLTNIAGLERIDLQLIAMIGDAEIKLAEEGITVKEKVFMTGFSASGMFTSRFTLLHPEIVEAAAIGSPGGWPIVPIDEWKGTTLNYPIGIADILEITGEEFNLEAFKAVRLYLYLGEWDTNDAVFRENREVVNPLFGETPPERWPDAQTIYSSTGCDSRFVFYPGIAHKITDETIQDTINFFSGVEPSAASSALPADSYTPTPMVIPPKTVTVNPASGPVGTPVTVTGSGFSKDWVVFLTIVNQNYNETLKTSVDGTITTTFSIPDGTPVGSMKIIINDPYTGTLGDTIFNVTPGSFVTPAATTTTVTGNVPVISNITPASGPVGTTVTVTGSGFTPNGDVLVFLDGQIIHTAKASGTGALTATFIIPDYISVNSLNMAVKDSTTNAVAEKPFTVTG
jgi:hypothetical protein